MVNSLDETENVKLNRAVNFDVGRWEDNEPESLEWEEDYMVSIKLIQSCL